MAGVPPAPGVEQSKGLWGRKQRVKKARINQVRDPVWFGATWHLIGCVACWRLLCTLGGTFFTIEIGNLGYTWFIHPSQT